MSNHTEPTPYKTGYSYGCRLKEAICHPEELARVVAFYRYLITGPKQDLHYLGAYDALITEE